jgi:hypothetical protein
MLESLPNGKFFNLVVHKKGELEVGVSVLTALPVILIKHTYNAHLPPYFILVFWNGTQHENILSVFTLDRVRDNWIKEVTISKEGGCPQRLSSDKSNV